jgi:DNA-binding NarL/FixJ family response regulator
VEDVQQLLRRHLNLTFPRPTLALIHEVSGGNPFYALELARVQSREHARDTTLPLTVPPSLERLVGARLNTLSAPTRRALLVVAAHGRLPVALARTMGLAPGAIERARVANVVEAEGGVIRFSHPLLASTLYQMAGEDECRGAHRRLAEVVNDPVDRGRHLALAAETPSDELAGALESAAGVARDRGLPIAAAELAEHALRLTPSDARDDWHRRAIAGARAHLAAGEGSRARAIATDLLAAAPSGRRRAEALLLRSELEPPHGAIGLREQALAEAKGAPELEAAIHAGLADAGFYSARKGFGWTERHARAAVLIAERLGDDALRADALSILATLRFSHCDPNALEMAELAYQLAAPLPDPRHVARAVTAVGLVLAWSGKPNVARDWLERRLAAWSDRDERVRYEIVSYLALVEFLGGRWDRANDYANQILEIGGQYGIENPYDLLPSALVALHRGDIEASRIHARRALGLGDGVSLEFFFGILATCDLWTGDPMASLSYFTLAERAADLSGEDEPAMRFWRPDQIEALIQLGRIQDATILLDHWEAAARRVGRERVIAQATRCRGLVAVARGDLSDGAETIETAVDMHQAAGDPFGRARTLLALGMTRRRLRQKRTAREAIEAASAAFVELGAAGWAATAREELARIGGRQRLEGLSPSEVSVATLAAEGRTNREIAAVLFLGERTVAGHLTHIYSKLGIRSRTELAGTLRHQGETFAEGAGKVARS